MQNTLSANRLRGKYLTERNAYIASGEPAIFHCHHYNCYLQAVLLDTSHYIKGIPELLKNTAHEIAYHQFTTYFNQYAELEIAEKKHIVEDYFRFAGFGLIDLSGVKEEGGIVETFSEHYGIAFKSKFGLQKEPVAFFSCGFLAGATEAIYSLNLGSINVKQELCLSRGEDKSRFDIHKVTSRKELTVSQQEGVYQVAELNNPETTAVDYLSIREAITQIKLEGAESTGLLEAFGVLLTRHYANYYSNISYGFLNLFSKQMGNDAISIAADLLTEAGHVCAFNTFGGVMQSNEWNAMIKPMLRTKEDWVHGMTAVVNAFGWGFWEVLELREDKVVMKITSGYESNAYLKCYTECPSIPISFLATGGVAGLMNLIYVLDLPSKTPITLDEEVYKQICSQKTIFKARQLKCRAQGENFDVIEASLMK